MPPAQDDGGKEWAKLVWKYRSYRYTFAVTYDGERRRQYDDRDVSPASASFGDGAIRRNDTR